jgi:hypothetical protein
MRQQTTGSSAPDEEGRYWMPLLPDVVILKWRFYKESDQTWLEEWKDSTWPDLIEIQLVMKDRTVPLRMVYSVPTLQLTAARNNAPTSGTNTSNELNNTNNENRGGNGGRNTPSNIQPAKIQPPNTQPSSNRNTTATSSQRDVMTLTR